MNKAFASTLALVAVVGATVGALPASANYGAVQAPPATSTNLSANILGATGTVFGGAGTGKTTLSNSGNTATLAIVSTAFTQYQSLVSVACTGNASRSDYSVGFLNVVSCPPATSLSSSAAFISVN